MQKWIELIELVGPKAAQAIRIILEIINDIVSGVGLQLAHYPPDGPEVDRLKKVLVKNGVDEHEAGELVNQIPLGKAH